MRQSLKRPLKAAEQLNRDGYNIYAPFNEIAEIRGSGVKDNNISKVRFVLIDVDRAGDTSRPASRSWNSCAVGLAMRVLKRFYITAGGQSQSLCRAATAFICSTP